MIVRKLWNALIGSRERAKGGTIPDYHHDPDRVTVRLSEGAVYVPEDCDVSDAFLMRVYGVGKVIRF